MLCIKYCHFDEFLLNCILFCVVIVVDLSNFDIPIAGGKLLLKVGAVWSLLCVGYGAKSDFCCCRLS